MSLFLVYFEVGKPVPPEPVPASLTPVQISVTFKGRRGPPRPGMALSGGGSAAPILAYGVRAVAREGEALRDDLFGFIRRRLASGARPHFAFVMFDGPVKAAEVDADHAERVAVEKLDAKLRDMSKGHIRTATEVVEVTA